MNAAIAAFTYALEIDFDCTPARWALAHLRMPGPDYLDLLARLHEWLQPQRYLEIGVFEGLSLALAQPPSLAIGLDPTPKILHGLTAPTIILPRTSDAQFSLQDPSADWGGGKIDFGFVDGLHVFEQALRDFSYLERVSAPGALIAVHDTIPFDRLSAEADRSTQFHTGDVWRIIPYLSALRPDLCVMTVQTPPSGLTLITNLNPQFNWAPHLDADVLAHVLLPDFDDQLRDPKGILRLIENDWAVICNALSPYVGKAWP
jgi:predicted O-methyltransferase YrrM